MPAFEKQIFEVVQKALNKETYQKPLLDEKRFFEGIYENGLIGLCYGAIQPDKVSNTLYRNLEKRFFEYVSKDEKQKVIIEEIRTLFNQQQVDFVFLKGTELKTIYPESYMRGMGDIDLLIHDKEMKKVHSILHQNGFRLVFKSKQHDGFEKHGQTIEIHPTLYKEFNPKYASLFKDPWQHTHPVLEHEHRFNPEFNVCYLLYHLAKHMDSSGVGVRSLLDIAVYLKHVEEKIDASKLDELLNQSDLKTFYQRVLELNQRWFGVSFNREETMCDEDFEAITGYIIQSGIHGTGRTYNPFVTRQASHNQTRFQLIASILFPSLETMEGMYPYLKKWKALLPFAWVQRWVHLAFRKTKESFKKIKKLNTQSQEVEKTQHILEKLGLKQELL